MSVVLNFKILDPFKRPTLINLIYRYFSVEKFIIDELNICNVAIDTNLSYEEIREKFRKSLFLHDENIEFITLNKLDQIHQEQDSAIKL